MASLKRKFEAAQRELGSVTEAEFARLANRDASAALAAMPAPLLSVDTLIHTIQQQHTAQPPAIDLQQQSNVVPLPALTRKTLEKEAPQAEGTGEEVLLQGFNWDRCARYTTCTTYLHMYTALCQLAAVRLVLNYH